MVLQKNVRPLKQPVMSVKNTHAAKAARRGAKADRKSANALASNYSTLKKSKMGKAKETVKAPRSQKKKATSKVVPNVFVIL